MRGARLLLGALILSIVPAVAGAGGFELAQQGAVAGGTAHASTARRDEASSAWFNPAALVDGAGLRLQLGLSVAFARIRSVSLAEAAGEPWDEVSITAPSTPPYAYASWAGKRWAAGLSFNVPFGGGIRWAEDWAQRYDSIESKPRFFRLAPFFAYRFGPVALSAGPHVDMGGTLIDKATNHVSEDGRVRIALRGVGVGGHASVFVSIGERFAAGATYKSRVVMNLKGEADFEVPAAFSPDFPDQPVSTRLVLPDRIALGFSYTAPRFLLVADVGLTLWSVNKQLLIDFVYEGTKDSLSRAEWRDSVVVRVGGEVRVHELVMLRAGVYVDGIPGAPAPPENLSPSSPDSTRIGVTVGAGFRPLEQLAVDLYVEQITLLRRASTSEDLPQASYGGWALTGGVAATLLLGPASP